MLPCYPDGASPSSFSSAAAGDMFAGGNQHSAAAAPGAAAAALVVTHGPAGAAGWSSGAGQLPTSSPNNVEWYTGSEPEGPTFWFVDLEADMMLTAVTITAGAIMRNVTVYLGNDASDAFANSVAASNVPLWGGQPQTMRFKDWAVHGRYVVVYSQGDPLSLAGVSVWPRVGNAAANKPITSSSGITWTSNDTVTAASPDASCTQLTKDAAGRTWATVDLGYSAQVELLTFQVAGNARGVQRMLYVSEKPALPAAPAAGVEAVPELCDAPAAVRSADAEVVLCPLRGRYVSVEVVGGENEELCNLRVYLAGKPLPAVVDDSGISTGAVVGIAVGCAVGGAVLVLLAIWGVLWFRRRRAKVGHATRGPGTIDLMKDLEGGSGELAVLPPHEARASGSSAATSSGGTRPGGHSGGISSVSSGAGITTVLSGLSKDNYIADFRELELLKPIGEGSFGVVFLAHFLQTPVAVKMLTMDTKRRGSGHGSGGPGATKLPPSPQLVAALEVEASIMASLRHPNVVQYLGACLDPPCLIMEHCAKKSLDVILASAAANPKGSIGKQLSWLRLLNMALDTAKGMLYLHSHHPPIIHRDLKSPNLLVDAHWHVKISDFNLSRTVEPGSAMSSLVVTNPRWLAPGVLRGQPATIPSDVFAFGVVLWELMTWELPWEGMTNSFQIIAAINNGQRLAVPAQETLPAGPLPPEVHDLYVQLMRDCWVQMPEDRPTMDEVARRIRTMLSLALSALGGKAGNAGL